MNNNNAHKNAHKAAQQQSAGCTSQKKRLTEAEKRAILIGRATGMTNKALAEKYDVHRNTISDLCTTMRQQAPECALGDWKQRFADLNELALGAVERSLQDTKNVHKAAATGQAHWKGTGVYANDTGTTTNNIYVDVRDLPADWRQRGMLGNDDDAELIERMRTAPRDVDSTPIDET